MDLNLSLDPPSHVSKKTILLNLKSWALDVLSNFITPTSTNPFSESILCLFVASESSSLSSMNYEKLLLLVISILLGVGTIIVVVLL